jgi:hypothetical protein
MINSFHSSGNSSLFQIEIISLWISQWIVLPPTLISSTGIRAIPGDFWLVSFSITNWTSVALGSGTSDSAVCISVCLPSSTPRTCVFNSWDKWFLHVAKILFESANKSYFSSSVILVLGWLYSLKSLIPLHKSPIFFILMLVSSSSILAFRHSFLLFLKCLLASRLTLFRLSTLFWFGFCTHCLACYLWSKKNTKHFSPNHGLEGYTYGQITT